MEESPAVKVRKTKISAKVKALQDKIAALSKSALEKVIPLRIKITQAGAAFKTAHLDEAEQRLEEAEEML